MNFPPPPSSLRQSCPIALAVLAGACMLHPVLSKADTISTDRPDFVESADVVGPGHVQVEAGFSSERDRANGVRTHLRTTPTLMRMGLNDTVELRVETDGRALAGSRDTATGLTRNDSGWSDTSFGVKWRQREGDEERGTPDIAWLAHVDVDSGSAAFRGQGVTPSLRMVAEWALPQQWSIGVMPGLAIDHNAQRERFLSGIFAVTLGKAWTPEWRTYLEVAGRRLARQRDGGSLVTLDAGVTYAVTHAVQVDFSVARGLTRETPRMQWGVGISVRF
ncbi:transporter [Variovorax ginsengisoli]|uniref:Transporter n=1 Tax=Variovorax ginsengisoli TaxID=363844 RepID=A0ABT9S5Y9_9BURK|nr:transporter [Variovorax ginsengisoli]MDP9899630.1 hypothetical protein [Variovorax ginsengisoli]